MRTWSTMLVLVIACGGDDGPKADGDPPSTTDTSTPPSTADTGRSTPGEPTIDGFRCHEGACLVTWTAIDADADGTADGAEDLVVLGPERTEARHDRDGDLVPDARFLLLEYDTDCNLTTLDSDEDQDGVFDFEGRYVWDAGRLIADSIELPGLTSWSTVYTYDGDGQLVHQDRDDGRDGTIDYVVDHTWDQGREIREAIDSNNDGSVDLVRFWAYNADGTLASQSTDYGDDGVADEVVTWLWDGDRPLSASTDFGADGTVERLESWVYDAQGNEVENRWDADNDGVPERRTLSTWNADGLRTERVDEEDFDGNGVIDSRSVTTWTYLGDLVDTESRDLDGDGTIDEVDTLTWTCPA